MRPINNSTQFSWQSGVISAAMTRAYGEINNDANAIHYDENAAREAGFHQPVVHGAITLALIHQACNFRFGPSWQAMGRLDVKLLNPLFVGNSILVELMAVSNKSEILSLQLCVTSSEGVIVARGEASMPIIGSPE